MKYTFYIDTFVGYQFCVQFLVQEMMAKVSKRETTLKRKLLTSLILTMTLIIVLLYRGVSLITRLVLFVICQYLIYDKITYAWLPWKEKIRLVGCSAAISFVMGGVILWGASRLWVLQRFRFPAMGILLFCGIVFLGVRKKSEKDKIIKQEIYPIVFENGNFVVKGLYDTGNNLCIKESGKKVWIIEETVWNQIKASFQDSLFESGEITYKSLGNEEGKLHYVVLPKVSILMHGVKLDYYEVPLGLTRQKLDAQNRFQAIIPPV